MVLSNEKQKEYINRILLSRMRILSDNGFYGLLLMHMNFSIDENCKTASTDGRRIFFGPRFLDELSDSELDFIMMHEILHVALQHIFRGQNTDCERFNIACDIVINSNILLSENMNINSISLKNYGILMHTAPDGTEGYRYTAEQVYAMLPPSSANRKPKPTRDVIIKNKKLWDDHTRWRMCEDDDKLRDLWVKHFEDACEMISIIDPSNQRGLFPLFAQRIFNEMKKPQTNWRIILNEFIQEETVDYSFLPPDKRFGDGDFFLPGFNDKDNFVENILFMVDTSASMTDKMITAAYSEINGAIEQFNGKLKGLLGFFDASVIEPKPFESEDEFKIIKPAGGGGTNFHIIFEYVQKYMNDNFPACIIILTDGYAPFPKENLSCGIPVLWLINNGNVTPPWGKIARIKI